MTENICSGLNTFTETDINPFQHPLVQCKFITNIREIRIDNQIRSSEINDITYRNQTRPNDFFLCAHWLVAQKCQW